MIFLYITGMQLIEAVPNISEAKNSKTLAALEEYLRQTSGVRLLHVDANTAANRTVFTLLGQPQKLCIALFHFITLAAQLIDMRTHHGAHPRLGAVDVCPLVPVQDISLAETAEYARTLGRQVAKELNIPVYLYEASAARAACKNLADIRRGEYEKLPEKLRSLPPDFGPQDFNEHVQKTGACIIGARNFLIAFNINLNTRDEQAAKQIAARIRQSSGGLCGVKAIGWYIENFARAQVSCNITDFHAAPLHIVFETCQKEAASLGLQATGCELVGLVPLQAILATGKHFSPSETNPHALIQAAVHGLNLAEVKPFSPNKQILEFYLHPNPIS